ncbi:MAG: hypothetical protein V4621_01845 [Pseudomonadota bacterium]
MTATDTNSRRVIQLRDIVATLASMCRHSPDEGTFRANLSRLANPDEGQDQRMGMATMLMGMWGAPITPAELYLDFVALHDILASTALPPAAFLHALEMAGDTGLMQFDTIKHDPQQVLQEYQALIQE